MQVYLIAAALATVVISVFAVQNSQQVTLQFLFWGLPSLPLVFIILFSAATGVLITLLFSLTRQIRQNLQIRDLQAKIKQLEKLTSKNTESGCHNSDTRAAQNSTDA